MIMGTVCEHNGKILSQKGGQEVSYLKDCISFFYNFYKSCSTNIILQIKKSYVNWRKKKSLFLPHLEEFREEE